MLEVYAMIHVPLLAQQVGVPVLPRLNPQNRKHNWLPYYMAFTGRRIIQGTA